MTQKNEDQISVYVSQDNQGKNLVPRLLKLGKRKQRSVNFLVQDAILAYLDLEEKK